MIVYATPDDLGTWVDDMPAEPDRLLRSATLLVALAAGRNPYSDSPPTGSEAQSLRDATCAQAAAWVRAGVDPTSGVAGDAPLVKRSEIGDAKVEYDTAASSEARARAVEQLANEARTILQVAGLLVVPVPLFDDSGVLPSWGLDSPRDYRWPPLSEWPFL